MTYTVKRHPHGIGVYGVIPVLDMVALCESWNWTGLTVIDAAIGRKLGATLAVTTPEGLPVWREELEIEED